MFSSSAIYQQYALYVLIRHILHPALGTKEEI